MKKSLSITILITVIFMLSLTTYQLMRYFIVNSQHTIASYFGGFEFIFYTLVAFIGLIFFAPIKKIKNRSLFVFGILLLLFTTFSVVITWSALSYFFSKIALILFLFYMSWLFICQYFIKNALKNNQAILYVIAIIILLVAGVLLLFEPVHPWIFSISSLMGFLPTIVIVLAIKLSTSLQILICFKENISLNKKLLIVGLVYVFAALFLSLFPTIVLIIIPGSFDILLLTFYLPLLIQIICYAIFFILKYQNNKKITVGETL